MRTSWRAGVAGTCAAVALCAGSGAHAQDRCIRYSADHYAAGIAYHLGHMGVAPVQRPGVVCVGAEFSAELEAVAREIDKHFWAIAYGLGNACEERAFVEWATKERLRFDVGDLVDLGGNVVGRAFHLRSFTDEEVASNRRKLNEAPRGTACQPEGMVG